MDIDSTDQPSPDPIHSHLRRDLRVAAADVDPGDREEQLGGVRRTAGRRRRRRQVLGGLAAAGVLVVGGVVAVNAVRDDGDDLLVSSDVTTTVTSDETDDDTTAQPAADSEPEPADDAPAPTAAVVEAPEPVVVEVGDPGSTYPGEAVVAWKDGFLRFGTTYTPQPLPVEFSDEIAAQFPPEVVELFEENGLPPTIDEASQMLSEAGLLDEVTDVLNANPDVSEAIYAESPPPPEVYAATSTDGVEWASVDLVLPAGWGTTAQVVSTGDRLVVAVEKFDGDPSSAGSSAPPQASYGVASTTDLLTWDVVELEPGDSVLPYPLIEYRWLDALAANETGWTAMLSSNTEIDPTFLEPLVLDSEPEARANYGTVVDEAIEVYFFDEATGRDVGTQRFTFEELAVSAADVPAEPWSSNVYAASWRGEVQRSNRGGPMAAVTAVDSGFIGLGEQIEFSTDGLAWSPVASPTGLTVPMSVMPLGRDAAALFRSDDSSVVAYRLRFPDMVWQPLDLPRLPDGAQVWGAAPTSAIVMPVEDFGEGNDSPTEFSVVVEPNYSVDLFFDGTTQSYTVFDLATGDVVLSESTAVPNDFDEAFEHLESGVDGGFTIVDPATGDVLVEVSDRMISEAQKSAPPSTMVLDEPPIEPAAWLLATTDGDSWLLERVPGGESVFFEGPHSVAANGAVVVVQTASATVTYELP